MKRNEFLEFRCCKFRYSGCLHQMERPFNVVKNSKKAPLKESKSRILLNFAMYEQPKPENMNKKDLYTRFTHPFKKLYGREHTIIGKQRLSLLLFCYLPILLIGILANFFGITQPSASFFNYTHTLLLMAIIIILALYRKEKINIGSCLSAFTFIGQSVLTIEMVYCALRPTPYYISLIMANIVLLTMNMAVSMAASMKRNTMFLGAATLGIYIVCSFLADDAVMKSFIPIFIIAFGFLSLIGVWMAKSVSKIESENMQMKREELEMLHLLRLKKDELKAFMSLAFEKNSHDGTKVLLDRLDRKLRHNLLTNVEEYLKTRNTDLEIIANVFPEFTQSEREICRLVIQGKKLGDICLILNKNESNINSQRANMRKKLELKPSENFQKALQQRLDDAKPGGSAT